MSEFEKIVYRLKEDVPVPEFIKENIEETISELPDKVIVSNRQKNIWKNTTAKVATIIGGVLLGSTTIYASANYSGIATYLEKVWNRVLSQEEAMLLETDVEQKIILEETEITPATGEVFQDYVNTEITEALCDNGQCIVEIVLTPAIEGKYIIVQNEEQLKESVLDDLGTSITLGEYAQKKEMEILYANITISESGDYESIISASSGAISYIDGSCHYTLSYEYPMEGQKHEFYCHVNVNGKSMENEFVYGQMLFSLCDKSQATTYVYVPEYAEEVEESNTIIDKVLVTKTELGLKCVTYYHLAEDIPENEKLQFGTFVWVLDENGERLEHSAGSPAGGSSKLTAISTTENSISWTEYYINMEMPEVLLVQPHDIVNEVVYEPVEVYLRQTK